MQELTCFKAYDVRGKLGDNLDADIVRRIGRAFAEVMKPGISVVGRDTRDSSATLAAALIEGLRDGGSDVVDIGLCGTEEVYFATTHLGAGGGLEVTASHNPIDYNGIKMVARGSTPISEENGMAEIRARASADDFGPVARRGKLEEANPRDAYVAHLLGFVDAPALAPLKILVNAGNGTAGPTFDAIASGLAAAGAPTRFIRMHHRPDSSFPNGIPNPLLPENQPPTRDRVIAEGADLGIAWDGDFDRCFFFDETGAFVPGEYIVGLLAEAFLAQQPGQTIIHDPRIIWNTQDIVASAGGRAVQSRTGHAFMKALMRAENAVYGGEMSAHHYFRDFMYCDSGMIPWLLVLELMSRTGKPLSALVADRITRFPSSGEVNFRLDDPKAAIARVLDAYAADALDDDRTDGIGLSFADWRFSLRSSNTEPVVRLNIESRGNPALVEAKLAEISALLTAGST
ncbi:phosphohexomutase domain-containing protein [Oceanomicrobium pacificus]|uniref:Phosphomannomutase n=1 Tax=Oceanomicrobium pacificus TaxID=2692916 RepID=A0A6B0TZS8_9RHOB|nr:phosphomannomutase [Oceanomicrobium pacificus]MXU66494.1 phosphomannomutase [Oceanomicrobium pacificus]